MTVIVGDFTEKHRARRFLGLGLTDADIRASMQTLNRVAAWMDRLLEDEDAEIIELDATGLPDCGSDGVDIA